MNFIKGMALGLVIIYFKGKGKKNGSLRLCQIGYRGGGGGKGGRLKGSLALQGGL